LRRLWSHALRGDSSAAPQNDEQKRSQSKVTPVLLGRTLPRSAACGAVEVEDVSYLSEERSLKLWLINGGCFTLMFTIMGALLGLIHI
jgi:hypothetical protein